MEQTIKNIERTIEQLKAINQRKSEIIKKMTATLDLAINELEKIRG